MRVFIQFEKKPLLFQNPKFIISCFDPGAIRSCFAEMESALDRGYYLAGFLSYEAGYSFEASLAESKPAEFPLICLGAYAAPSSEDLARKKPRLQNQLNHLRLNISKEKYFKNIETIRSFIREGEVYQVTYCLKLLFSFCGDPLSLYARLLQEQPVPYPAYLETDSFQILSLSPEMFFKNKSGAVVTKPMKGTWPRGKNLFEDLAARQRFQYDEKNRAENVMIADLLRNDLGRVGKNIHAPRLFEVAKYRTLFQMTSTVTGAVNKNTALADLFGAIFPSGSVTGAPKISAMKIIRDLEREPRHIYTGAIGYITPQRDMFFNVPIRTLLLRDGKGELGIGGGIVWDSTPQGEWDEGLLKAQFVTGFQLGCGDGSCNIFC